LKNNASHNEKEKSGPHSAAV